MNKSLVIALLCVVLAGVSSAEGEKRVKRYLVAPPPPSYWNPPTAQPPERNGSSAPSPTQTSTPPPKWIHTFASPYEILFGRRPYALGWI